MSTGAEIILDAPRANLTQVSPIAGSEDLLVVRGAGVRELRARRGLGPVIARGRDGLRLRGAGSWKDGIVTWSSRRWMLVEGGGSSEVSPPAADRLD